MSRSLAAVVALVVLGSSSVASAQTEPTPPPPSPAPPSPTPPKAAIPSLKQLLEWNVGDLKLKFGGYVKLDLIHDFNQIGSTDSFDPRTIPVHGDPTLPSDNTVMHARQTRLNVDLSGPSSAGPFRIFVEGDFFGSGNSFRLRHAYGTTAFEAGTLLAGQTWSTFMDDAAMPETLDFESPTAFPQIRQAQARFTRSFEGGSYVAVALEDPSKNNDVLTPPGVTGAVETTLPDLNARLHWKHDRGHVQLGIFSGMVRFDPATGSTDNVFLWGFNLSTKLQTWEKDNAIVQVTYGDGVARYRGGVTAAPDSSGELEAVGVIGLLGSYQHHWSEKFRSSAGYSWAGGDLPSGAPTGSAERTTYAFANLIWQFSERAWTGVEYLYGSLDTNDHAHGADNRIQFSLRFDL